MIELNGQDVLPWFREPETVPLQVGTRLHSFSEYNAAPVGTVVRFGRKNNLTGEDRVKRESGAWEPIGSNPDSPNLTNYGMEGLISYVVGVAS